MCYTVLNLFLTLMKIINEVRNLVWSSSDLLLQIQNFLLATVVHIGFAVQLSRSMRAWKIRAFCYKSIFQFPICIAMIFSPVAQQSGKWIRRRSCKRKVVLHLLLAVSSNLPEKSRVNCFYKNSFLGNRLNPYKRTQQ